MSAVLPGMSSGRYSVQIIAAIPPPRGSREPCSYKLQMLEGPSAGMCIVLPSDALWPLNGEINFVNPYADNSSSNCYDCQLGCYMWHDCESVHIVHASSICFHCVSRRQYQPGHHKVGQAGTCCPAAPLLCGAIHPGCAR